ncbi:peptide/nickel transport system permease protein [Actinoplanes octamycinicus]|uniref:Peptide/nickel transport system permease protein n=1 Tax=Actinoplanes octamycinicus TaxID=135948 RepID=A0A7W7M9R1_9ACTN|nr:dipeptide/oligopeptide/nickel ABC transporter permease/ATP-binding protein [Actinoplanes octamycinicus]MBB4742126.1 peptide/nickel transport system permease protein [Actinoplanes octamycinicus]GIE60028.1 ABC transporter [Actinoplanes octamycinicus]
MLAGIRRLPLSAQVCLGFLLVVVAVGIAAPWLTRYDPTQVALAPPSTGPSGDFWFGVDRLGRDIYSRLIAGTPRSLVIGFGSAGLALALGALLGAIAATSRRALDETVMRVLDVIMAFPTIVLAAILVVAYGHDSVPVLVGAIGFVMIPQIARLVRANVAAQYQEDYVAAERVIGAGRAHILRRHVVRNCAAPILVYTTVMVANAIVFEASLSFIGGGLQPEAGPSSWGSVIAYGQQLLASGGWWATFFPGLLILITVLCLNILAEGISDAWAAPAARRRAGAATGPIEISDAERESAVALPGLAQAAARLAATARPPITQAPIVSVRDLHLGFAGSHHGVDIVDGVSFDVRPGEVLGLIGESGCGKSLTALTVMGLQPRGARTSGAIEFAGTDLLTLSTAERRKIMGRRIAMIYQDALSALNPSMTVRAQLKQIIKRGGTRTAEELMALVGLDPIRTLSSYPHELSGGQRQRVVIAMALARDPQLVVADEPTTALDVTVQAQVIHLLLRLRAELGFALILVSHDLALVSDVCDRIAVMYGGRIVEEGRTAQVLAAPTHHYTRGLLGSVLSLEAQAPRLVQIRGTVPSPADFPAGCRFADRCPRATRICADVRPPLADVHGHLAACHHPAQVEEVEKVAVHD